MKSCYPPAPCVRFCKTLAMSLAVTLVMLSFLILIVITASRSSFTMRRRGRPESLEQMVERLSVCDRWSEFFKNNATNSTIEALCRNLTQMRRDYYRTQDTRVNPYQHDFLITGKGICDNQTEAILLIHSLHTYEKRREAIRQTWGGASVSGNWPRAHINDNIKMAFVFGIHQQNISNDKLKQESAKYGDVIQGNFYESYQNMTLKSLLGLKWVLEYCPSAKYLIKSDDDMIINMPALLKVLNKGNMSRSILGPYNVGSRVYRAGKWNIKHAAFPFYYFPPYESGSAYVITSDLIRPLFETSEYVPSIFIDDVYITGILGKILNVTHIRQAGFAFWTDKKPSACNITENQILTGTKMTPEYMLDLWRQMVKGPQCHVEASSRLVL